MKRHTREEYIYIYTCILISSECIDRKTIETVDNRAIFVSSQVFFLFLHGRSCTHGSSTQLLIKTFSFILAMDWRGVALAFLSVSKESFLCYSAVHVFSHA